MRKLTRFPFDPKRLPFFYGFVILALGAITATMTLPGQTMGFSVFNDFLIDALGISRLSLSMAYLVGTISSAFVLTPAGKLYDKAGPRLVGTFTAALLGLTLFYLSRVDGAARAITETGVLPQGVASFVSIAFGFFAARFLGQGVLSLVARNIVMTWFERRRGMANAILGATISFGFSAAPRLLNSLIELGSWRQAWRSMGWVIGVGFPILFFLIARDSPSVCGMQPDGTSPDDPSTRSASTRGSARLVRRLIPARIRLKFSTPLSANPEHTRTLREAMRTYSFWVFMAGLTVYSFYVTGLTFHVVSIFAEAGMDRAKAVSIFLPASVISVILGFNASWLSDFTKMKYFLMAQLVGLSLSATALALLSPGAVVVLMIVGNGINIGFFGLLSSVTWPRFYGVRHLGEISGFAMGWMVAGSAVGPYAFSLSLDLLGSFRSVGWFVLAVAVVLFVFATRADRP